PWLFGCRRMSRRLRGVPAATTVAASFARTSWCRLRRDCGCAGGVRSQVRGRDPACGARIDPIHWQVEVGAAAIGGLSLGIAPDMAGLSLALFGLMLLPLALLGLGDFFVSHPLVFS